MIIITMILIIIINLILQGTVLPFFDFLVYLPNIALVSVVVISLLKGKYYGAFFGLIMGLFQDVLFEDIVGIYGLIYFLTGYTLGLLEPILNHENTAISAIFASVSTISYNLMYFIIMYFLSRNIPLMVVVKRIFSIEILYNLIIAVFLHKLFYKILRIPSYRFIRR